MNSDFRKSQVELYSGRYKSALLYDLAQEHGTPLMVFDKECLINQYNAFVSAFPKVIPHFAIKSCPHPEVLKVLRGLDAHLDVATTGEIEILKPINYPESRLIHTHPHKKPKEVDTAYEYGIRSFVIDSLAELDVLEQFKENISISIRLSFSNDKAHVNLSYKFGLSKDEALQLLELAKNRGFKVNTVCFHVGSQLEDPQVFVEALEGSADFINQAKQRFDHNFEILDIGGGFPATYDTEVPSIQDFADAINPKLDSLFSDELKIYAEPGRHLINGAVFNLSSVVSTSVRSGKNWAFIDDGVYGSFSDMLTAGVKYPIYAVSEFDSVKPNTEYILGGPTCDSIDVPASSVILPSLHKGDILFTPNIGAYSWTLSTTFNSLPIPKFVAI